MQKRKEDDLLEQEPKIPPNPRSYQRRKKLVMHSCKNLINIFVVLEERKVILLIIGNVGRQLKHNSLSRGTEKLNYEK